MWCSLVILGIRTVLCQMEAENKYLRYHTICLYLAVLNLLPSMTVSSGNSLSLTPLAFPSTHLEAQSTLKHLHINLLSCFYCVCV